MNEITRGWREKDWGQFEGWWDFLPRVLLVVLIVIAAEVLIATCAEGQTVPGGAQCTDPGWYRRACDQSWVFINPQMAGHIIPNGCSAHTQLIYGANGAQYPLIDQCPQGCTGTQGLYKKPDDPVALPQWNFFYTDPNALQHRTQFGYIGPGVPPSGILSYTFVGIDQIPDPPRQTLKNAYGCNSPTPTAVPTPVPTPAPSIYAKQIEAIARAGILAGCGGGKFCPDVPMTRAQVATALANALKLPLLPCENTFSDVKCAP